MENPFAGIALQRLDGAQTSFGALAGRATLVVNVASQCGFTPQYEGLETLYRRCKARGFVVLGFPCDQFGHQEPGEAAEIARFCTSTYDVTFPVFAKTLVNGPHAHPLFAALKDAAPGLLGTQAIKWNFTKFLVDGSNGAVKRHAPTLKPAELAGDVEAILARSAA